MLLANLKVNTREALRKSMLPRLHLGIKLGPPRPCEHVEVHRLAHEAKIGITIGVDFLEGDLLESKLFTKGSSNYFKSQLHLLSNF